MALISKISSIDNLHGKTARAVEFAMKHTTKHAIIGKSITKTITPKTITKR